jgi:aryl-alcohol dehydrogenase-like predicted oxidoreductase/histidinol phosphatase-like enzyme/predicted kinase
VDRQIGMGAMRLSTARDRDEHAAVAVLHAAFDAGVTFLDTADVYCRDERDVGHNERLITRALASWPGDRSRIRVATKGGMTRPEGAWVVDGRARHLRAACEASRQALGVDRIALYQLHAPDPRTPLTTSVRALAALKRDGLIEAIGLCNVTVSQLDRAREIAEISAVQVELSLWHETNILSGIVDYCRRLGIQLIAYRPLGGPQRQRRLLSDPVLAYLAARHRASGPEIALAWLLDLPGAILPIAGPSRVDHVQSLARASQIRLDDDDRRRLTEAFPAARLLAREEARRHAVSRPEGEVVMIMGLPAAGKTTLSRSFFEQGYTRLNRDEQGGSLRDLVPAFERLVDEGVSRIVLDNTYISRKARAAVVRAAHHRRLPVRCIWLTTSLEEAQTNAVERILAKHGRLLEPEELRHRARLDANVFGPTAQFRYQRELEPPDLAEGFSHIEQVEFERAHDPSRTNRAVVFWCEGVLRRSRSGQRSPVSAEDVDVLPGRADALRDLASDGWRLLSLSWLPEIAEGRMTAGQAAAAFTRTQELLGVPVEIAYCPHAAGPPMCWCRKPLPGLGVVFINRHKLDPQQCLYVGAGTQDPGLARRLGFQYRDAAEFFGKGQPPRD